MITLDLTVTQNTPTTIHIRQVVLEQPEFRSVKTREDVSKTDQTFRLTVNWIMRREGAAWLI
ncbi:MAG: hypothetical protein M3174_00530, partial [Actinomycetota bacterium]|nr:hypothetical protein [Actinomycetota bacterium]